MGRRSTSLGTSWCSSPLARGVNSFAELPVYSNSFAGCQLFQLVGEGPGNEHVGGQMRYRMPVLEGLKTSCGSGPSLAAADRVAAGTVPGASKTDCGRAMESEELPRLVAYCCLEVWSMCVVAGFVVGARARRPSVFVSVCVEMLFPPVWIQVDDPPSTGVAAPSRLPGVSRGWRPGVTAPLFAREFGGGPA